MQPTVARLNKDTFLTVAYTPVFTDAIFTSVDPVSEQVDWGDSCDLIGCSGVEPGNIVRDLGRFANFYDETNTLISTFRQIQWIKGVASEGVDGPTTTNVWQTGWICIFSLDLIPFSSNYVRA